MDLTKALAHLIPGAQWMLFDNSYERLQWNDPRPKPTLQELEAAWDELSAPKPPPPVVVTMRSFRLVLGRARYIELMAFIGAIPDAEQKFQAQTFVEYSLTVAEDHPLVLQIAAALKKSEAEMKAIFATAKQLDNP